jgi:predicted glycosyltransferase
VTARPTLLFYCQHSLGLGHLARSVALCAALAERFRVILLSGGALPANTVLPDEVEVLSLPPLALAPDGRIVSEDDRYTPRRARAIRRERILATLRAARPAVLVIELFPFGRKKFADELLPLLEEARGRHAPAPLVACSLRDILVSRGDRQNDHDERACALANRYFDLVLVHSDPRFARLEESFRPVTPLRAPVHHTGFVLPAAPRPGAVSGPPRVVVSAGGGRVGEPLVRAAVAAHGILGPRPGIKVIAGPFLPHESWRSLRAAADGRAGLEIVRSVEGLEVELRSASASVSQCGYNTALEVVRSGVPALVVPFAAEGEDEQSRRARRLASLGAVRVLDPPRLDASSLAAEIRALAGFRPRPPELDLTGSRTSAELLSSLLRAREAA